MNRQELFNTVADYLDRGNIPVTSMMSWTAALEGELNQKLRTHPRMMQRAEWTQPPDTPILPLPEDLIQLVWLRDDVKKWRQYPLDARDLAKSAGMAGASIYVAYGDCLELFPTPVESTTFYMTYYATIRALADASSTNWVATYYSDIYLYGLLKEAAIYLKDDDRLQAWGAIFTARIEQLILQGWDQNWSSAPSMVPE